MTKSPTTWRVGPLAVTDETAWRSLMRDYASFMGSPQTQDQAVALWGWLQDPSHTETGLGLFGDDGRLRGFVLVRTFPRPLSASAGGYVDAVYVEPSARGTGAGDALLRAVAERAADWGWTLVRWVTEPDNSAARRVYDRHATARSLITYDMKPGRPARG